MNTPNFHIIEVHYLRATNIKGSRVKMVSHRFKQSKTIDFDYEHDNTASMAIARLTANGFEVVGKAESKNGYYIICSTFKPFRG